MACAAPAPVPVKPAPVVVDDVAATLIVDNTTRDSVGVYFIDGLTHVRLGGVTPASEARLPVKRFLLKGRKTFRIYAFRGVEACPVARVIDITSSTTPRMTVAASDSVLSGYLPADACVKK